MTEAENINESSEAALCRLASAGHDIEKMVDEPIGACDWEQVRELTRAAELAEQALDIMRKIGKRK